MTDPDDEREEYAGWSLPGADERDERKEVDEVDEGDEGDEDWGPPPAMREPLFRDRIRDWLGVTETQWFVLETFLLVLPYPLFVLVYVSFDVNETLFLVLTLGYSLVAMYVGLLS